MEGVDGKGPRQGRERETRDSGKDLPFELKEGGLLRDDVDPDGNGLLGFGVGGRGL